MHVLVPQKIIRDYQEGNRNGEFQAIGLFVDISGFSKLTNDLMQLGQHGAEILANVMRETFSPLVNSVYSHHGFIATFAGDAFTALFPLDQGIEQASLHALSAAWEIQEKIAGTKFQINGEAVSISTRAGLSCGDAQWGIVTSKEEHRAVYYYRGEAIENCAEAESLASSGDTIIDPVAHELLQSFITCEGVSSHYRVIEVRELLPGTDIPQPDVVDLDTASLFYPRDLITQTSSGEFRQIVNMFINLPTVRTEEQLSIFMQYIFKLQDQYGGLLNRIDFGDKGSHLLLFWGAPLAYENDIGRALNFILALQTETSIPIKAGITYRIAHAGFIGATLREEYTCYGQGVNLAARFMTAAPRGEVWIDEPIAKRMAHYFDVELIDEILPKGFQEPQNVYALYERKESTAPFYKGPYIGRKLEQEQMAAFVVPLWKQSYAGAMVIAGEAGIGKSRLLHEFLQNSETIQQHQVTIALCHTDQVLRSSFNPFRYWLRRYFGVSETQVEARNKRSFNQTLDALIEETQDLQLAGELDRTRSFLAALVNLFWEDSLYEQLDPKGRYENTVTALINLIKAESLKQPIILHLEDIQWLDEDSRMVLSQLDRIIKTDQSRDYPVAMIGTSRQPDLDSPLGEEIPCQWLKLEPLSDGEITELTESHLQSPVEDKLAAFFSSLSEGNPFYAEQILYYMQEEDLLELVQDQWKLRPTETMPTPTDVRALLVSRIDQFPNEIKEIMLKASVLGREFDKPVLLRMDGDDQTTNEKIRILEEAAVWTEISSGKYLFRSNLLRETAYQMQILTRRQKLHAAAAEALEELYEEDLQPYYFELAHHTELGKLKQKACKYLLLAGEMAAKNYQNNQAIDYFTRALQHTETEDLETQLVILMKREKSYDHLGRREDQKNDLDKAEALAEQIDHLDFSAEIAVRRILYHSAISQLNTVISESPTAVALAEKAQRPELIVSVNISWANVLRLSGDYEGSRQRLELTRKLTQQIGDLRGECSSLNTLSLVEVDLGNFKQARFYLEECLRIAEKEGKHLAKAQTLNNLGVVASDQGDYSSASNYYQRSLKIAQMIGFRMGEGLLTLNLGWLAGILGDYPTSIDFLQRSHRIQREIGDGFGEATSLFNLSLFTGALGEYQQAKQYAEEGVTLSRAIQYRSGESVGLAFLGHALTGLGAFSEAKEVYRQAFELRQEMVQTNLCCEAYAGLAQISLLEGDLPAAEDSVSKIFEHLEQGGTLEGIDHPNFVNLICYKVLDAANDARAEPFLNEIHTALRDQAAKIQDEARRQSFLNNVPWHQEIIREFDRKPKRQGSR